MIRVAKDQSYVAAYVTKVPSMTNKATPAIASVSQGPPARASESYASYISAMSFVSAKSAAAARESVSLKKEEDKTTHDLKAACNGDKKCEKQTSKALKGKIHNSANNLQLQLTAVVVGFAALGGAFMLV